MEDRSEPSRPPVLRLVAQPGPLPRPASVLLVDDDARRRAPLVRALRDRGHSVRYAANGASGEALCRSTPSEIDALIVGAEMKLPCGCELARRVIRMRPEVRVLLMSRRFAGPDEAQHAHEHGYAVIEEPFTPGDLCRRLSGLLVPACDGADADPDAEPRGRRRRPSRPARGRGSRPDGFQERD